MVVANRCCETNDGDNDDNNCNFNRILGILFALYSPFPLIFPVIEIVSLLSALSTDKMTK